MVKGDRWRGVRSRGRGKVMRRSNLAKHGINFSDAQQLWADAERVEIPARTEDETRSLIIGKVAQKYWSAIITYRENRVRIISVRQSRKEEVALYESNRI